MCDSCDLVIYSCLFVVRINGMLGVFFAQHQSMVYVGGILRPTPYSRVHLFITRGGWSSIGQCAMCRYFNVQCVCFQCSIFKNQYSIQLARYVTWFKWSCTIFILILLLIETMSIHQLLLTYYFSYIFSGNTAWLGAWYT